MLLLLTISASWTGAKAEYWEAKEGDHAIVNGIHFLINGFGTATVTNTQYLGEGFTNFLKKLLTSKLNCAII